MEKKVPFLLFLTVLLLMSGTAMARDRISEDENIGTPVLSCDIGSGPGQVGIIRDTKGTVPYGMFYGPSSFTVAPDGHFYIVDTLNSRFLVFSENGSFERAIPYLINPANPARVADILVDDKNIIFSDFTNRLIITLDLEGNFISGFGGPGNQKDRFKQVDLLGRTPRHILVRDSMNGSIKAFTKDGNFAFEVPALFSIFTDSSGAFFTVSEDRQKNEWIIERRNIKGELINQFARVKKERSYRNIELIGIDLKNYLYVKILDSTGIFILKFSPDGRKEKKIKAHNRPGLDAWRYFVVSPGGSVYSFIFDGQKYSITKLD